MARRVTLVAVLILVTTATAWSQIVAKQGEPTEQRFESPMVLEQIPIPLNAPSTWDGQTTINLKDNMKDNLDRFICDNVSIDSFLIEPLYPTRKGLVPFRFTVGLRNRPGHDKLVNLRITLTSPEGEQLCEPIRSEKIGVEERQSARRILKLWIPKELLKPGKQPTMKIELSAVDY
jgi:hypothetical protein